MTNKAVLYLLICVSTCTSLFVFFNIFLGEIFYRRLFRVQENQETIFVLLDSFFRYAEEFNVDVFVTEGALLCIKRQHNLCPWDHDVDFRGAFAKQTKQKGI